LVSNRATPDWLVRCSTQFDAIVAPRAYEFPGESVIRAFSRAGYSGCRVLVVNDDALVLETAAAVVRSFDFRFAPRKMGFVALKSFGKVYQTSRWSPDRVEHFESRQLATRTFYGVSVKIVSSLESCIEQFPTQPRSGVNWAHTIPEESPVFPRG